MMFSGRADSDLTKEERRTRPAQSKQQMALPKQQMALRYSIVPTVSGGGEDLPVIVIGSGRGVYDAICAVYRISSALREGESGHRGQSDRG